MGNLPCCNANEEQKPTAFSTHSSSAKNKNNALADGQQLVSPLLSNGKAQTLSQTSDHNLSNYNSSSPAENAEKYQLLEQQRALLQKEQERLERIVNDAGWAMVHVNGTAGGISSTSSVGGMGMSAAAAGGSNMNSSILMGHSTAGGGNASTTTRAMGYYDANYAAEVWQDLIPGRNGGGLIAMCQKEMDSKQQQQQQQKLKKEENTRASLWKTVPKGAWMDNSQILENLNHYGSSNGDIRRQLWNEESVRLLNELIVADNTSKRPFSFAGDFSISSPSSPSSSSALLNGASGVSSSSAANHGTMPTTTMNEGESMERLVDDLAEKFLASVFQEGRLDGLAPIVENVL